MNWINLLERQNLCTLCKKYDDCTSKPQKNYACWEEKEDDR